MYFTLFIFSSTAHSHLNSYKNISCFLKKLYYYSFKNMNKVLEQN